MRMLVQLPLFFLISRRQKFMRLRCMTSSGENGTPPIYSFLHFFYACNIHRVIVLSNNSYDCISLSDNGIDAFFSNVIIVLTISASSNIDSKKFMYLATDRGSSHWRRRATGRYIVWYKPSAISHLISIHARRWSENPVNCAYPPFSMSSAGVPKIPL